jgi:hypothetical protein
MSVASPVIGSLDPEAGLIFLASGIRAYHPVTDLYAEMRNLRRLDESLRRYQMPLTAFGNIPKGGGKFTPRFVVFQNNWRVIPEDVSHILQVTGEQLTAEGGGGPDCFDLSLLSPESKVIIQYEPPAAEIIVVGGSGDVLETIRKQTATMMPLVADLFGR